MPVLYPIKNLHSVEGSQHIGKPNLYGTSFYAWSEYGDSNPVSGIYRIRHYNGKKYRERMEFYLPRILNSVAQTTAWTKFKNGVLAWQALAISNKAEYNYLAVGKHMSGFNLFLSRYMKL